MKKYKGPFVYPTVDIAILNAAGGEELLLGRKPDQKRFQFIGGFADVNSASYEDDAIREVKEECGIRIFHPKYIGSTLIDDERYEGGVDRIKTLFFVSWCWGTETPKAMDDIVEVKWFNIFSLKKNKIVKKHHVLFDQLLREKSLGKI